MGLPIDLHFNPSPSTIMHIDINSCFATIEQQANPLLRGKPIAVVARDTPNGCIIAPSVEAKRLGIKVGMRAREGRQIFPGLVLVSPDSDKYRAIHLSLKRLLSDYTPSVTPKSIDEFVLDFSETPALHQDLWNVGREIKERIRKEIGEYLTVSVGLGPSRFLAKTASNLHKPDGLDEINKDNFFEVYSGLSLTDLNGIATQNASRLNTVSIFTVLDFFQADLKTLRSAFKSVMGYYWFVRLRGWEVDDVEWGVKSFGHSYALPKFVSKIGELAPILSKLVEKLGFRMRGANFQTKGVHLGLLFENHKYWHRSVSLDQSIFQSQDIYRVAYRLLSQSPHHLPVRNLAVSCYDLSPRKSLQLGLFENRLKKELLVKAMDDINDRWGSFVIAPATMAHTQEAVPDRIGFGNIRGLA